MSKQTLSEFIDLILTDNFYANRVFSTRLYNPKKQTLIHPTGEGIKKYALDYDTHFKLLKRLAVINPDKLVSYYIEAQQLNKSIGCELENLSKILKGQCK